MGGGGCLGVCIVGLDDGGGMWEGMLSVLVHPTGEMVRDSCGSSEDKGQTRSTQEWPSGRRICEQQGREVPVSPEQWALYNQIQDTPQ